MKKKMKAGREVVEKMKAGKGNSKQGSRGGGVQKNTSRQNSRSLQSLIDSSETIPDPLPHTSSVPINFDGI